jgi:hypothetical protein
MSLLPQTTLHSDSEQLLLANLKKKHKFFPTCRAGTIFDNCFFVPMDFEKKPLNDPRRVFVRIFFG